MFQTAVPSCHRTCDQVHQDLPDTCFQQLQNWCTCPPGTYLQNGTCVTASDCQCEMHGISYTHGDVVQQQCNEWWVSFSSSSECKTFKQYSGKLWAKLCSIHRLPMRHYHCYVCFCFFFPQMLRLHFSRCAIKTTHLPIFIKRRIRFHDNQSFYFLVNADMVIGYAPKICAQQHVWWPGIREWPHWMEKFSSLSHPTGHALTP